MYRFCVCSIVVLASFIFALHAKAVETSAFGGFRVAGYLPDYRCDDQELEGLASLTDLILFSAQLDQDGSLNETQLAKFPWEKLLEFKTKHRVRLFLTIGGWGRSDYFPIVASSEESRQRAVNAITRFAIEHRLDGIDLDWEHPKDVAEQELYGLLLSDLRVAFKRHGLMLTVTIAAWQKLPPSAVDAVDAVQVMAYDHPGEHSTFANSRRDVQALLDAGIPSSKIVLGLPFYGRDVTNSEAKTYREIVDKLKTQPDGLRSDRLGTIYFNGPKTIHEKTKFAVDGNLAGVMIWEIAQDAVGDDSLLRQIDATLR